MPFFCVLGFLERSKKSDNRVAEARGGGYFAYGVYIHMYTQGFSHTISYFFTKVPWGGQFIYETVSVEPLTPRFQTYKS